METPHPLTVAFAMLSEVGHYAGTFRLARSLRERGHRVVYIGIADFAPLVNAQEFEFIPFAADLLPVGHVREFAASQSDHSRGLLRRWRKRLSDERLFAEYLRRVEDGRLDECLLSCKPNLLLCDTFLWYVALRALRAGIPTISISTILSLYRNPRIPPIVSPIHFRQTLWSTFHVRASWRWLRLKFFFTKRLASLLVGTFRSPTRMHHLTDVFLRIAKRAGYRYEENKTYWFGEMGPRLALPEIVLCPEAFQLPGSPADGRRYLGEFIDLERREEPLDADALHDGKPLVYCSLGSSPFFYPHANRFFRAVVDASRLRKDWQFVLHVSDYQAAEKLGPPEPNLLIRERVPQLSLLRRASVMVTHGGMNSIMECVHFGVPMVIVPGLRDQPGNATRAVHHGLALTASMARITSKRLVILASRAMGDGGIRRALTRMKRKIAEENGLAASIRFIESFTETLSGSRNSAPGRDR